MNPSIALGLKKAGETAKKILTSRTFWIIVGILIILLIIRRYWDLIGDKLTPLKGDFAGGISDARKVELDDLIDELATKIYGNYVFEDREEILLQVLGLNDKELLYFNKNYSRYHNNLIEDVDNEWLPFTDADEKLIKRLNGMGIY